MVTFQYIALIVDDDKLIYETHIFPFMVRYVVERNMCFNWRIIYVNALCLYKTSCRM